MAIPSRQIGWGTKSNLLWQISKQLERLICVTANDCSTTTTTSTSSTSSTTTTTTTTAIPECIGDYDIGQRRDGGTVAYILQPGDPGYNFSLTQGYIATFADLADAEWGCINVLISGADGTALGTGNQNTIDIMAGCPTAGIAARLCGDLVQGGYSDWYLPSQDELNKLYLNQIAIGGFVGTNYWSSTEDDADSAFNQDFTNGVLGDGDKIAVLSVRPIRSFVCSAACIETEWEYTITAEDVENATGNTGAVIIINVPNPLEVTAYDAFGGFYLSNCPSGYSGGGFAFNSGQIGTFTLCSVDEPYIWYYHNDAAVFLTVTDTLTPC